MSAAIVQYLDVDIERNYSVGGSRIHPISSSPMSEHGGSTNRRQTHIPLSDRLGLNDFFSMNVWRASFAELIGTAVLVFMLDCIVISTLQSNASLPTLIMSILIAVTLSILLLATFPISGGHLNPVITFSVSLVGLISLSRAFIYILAQCVGAMLGALALKAVVSSDIQQTFSLGGCTLSIILPPAAGSNASLTVGIETSQAFWLEIFCTFGFLFASVWMACDPRQAKNIGLLPIFAIIGLVVGMLVFASTTVTNKRGYAGAGMNPARCFGAAVVHGGRLWDEHWVFWVGPTISCFAFYIYTKIIPRDHFHPEGYKHNFFGVVKASLELIE